MKKKLMGAVLTAALTALIAGGCGQSTNGSVSETAGGTSESADESMEKDTDESTNEGTVVRVGIDTDIASIAPYGAMDGGRAYVYHMIYEYMAGVVEFGSPVEEMDLECAKSIEQVDEHTLEIEMYDYIYDAAGNHITAQDYVWSANTMKESGNYPLCNAFLESVEATGDYTVVMKTTEGAGLGNTEWLLSMIPVISQKAYEDSGDNMTNAPVTTAMYQVDHFTSGSGITLKKNENYWQTDESLRWAWAVGNVDTIEMKVITEPAQMSVALQTGEIDMGELVHSSILSNFYVEGQAVDGYLVDETTSTMVYGALYNCSSNSLCSDENLRKAISYAIDSQQVVDFAADGLGLPLHAFANPVANDYNTEWDSEDYYDYNPDKAAEYLAQSDYNGESLVIVGVSVTEKMAQTIQSQLAAVGINAELNIVDGALEETTYADPSAWDIGCFGRGCDDYCTFTWGLLFNANSFEEGRGTYNYVRDDKLQSLFEEVSAAATHNAETVEAFEDYLTDKCYGIGIFTELRYRVANTGVVNSLLRREGGEIIIGGCEFNF